MHYFWNGKNKRPEQYPANNQYYPLIFIHGGDSIPAKVHPRNFFLLCPLTVSHFSNDDSFCFIRCGEYGECNHYHMTPPEADSFYFSRCGRVIAGRRERAMRPEADSFYFSRCGLRGRISPPT